jgi:hypothetical protein
VGAGAVGQEEMERGNGGVTAALECHSDICLLVLLQPMHIPLANLHIPIQGVISTIVNIT